MNNAYFLCFCTFQRLKKIYDEQQENETSRKFEKCHVAHVVRISLALGFRAVKAYEITTQHVIQCLQKEAYFLMAEVKKSQHPLLQITKVSFYMKRFSWHFTTFCQHNRIAPCLGGNNCFRFDRPVLPRFLTLMRSFKTGI